MQAPRSEISVNLTGQALNEEAAGSAFNAAVQKIISSYADDADQTYLRERGNARKVADKLLSRFEPVLTAEQHSAFSAKIIETLMQYVRTMRKPTLEACLCIADKLPDTFSDNSEDGMQYWVQAFDGITRYGDSRPQVQRALTIHGTETIFRSNSALSRLDRRNGPYIFLAVGAPKAGDMNAHAPARNLDRQASEPLLTHEQDAYEGEPYADMQAAMPEAWEIPDDQTRAVDNDADMAQNVTAAKENTVSLAEDASAKEDSADFKKAVPGQDIDRHWARDTSPDSGMTAALEELGVRASDIGSDIAEQLVADNLSEHDHAQLERLAAMQELDALAEKAPGTQSVAYTKAEQHVALVTEIKHDMEAMSPHVREIAAEVARNAEYRQSVTVTQAQTAGGGREYSDRTGHQTKIDMAQNTGDARQTPQQDKSVQQQSTHQTQKQKPPETSNTEQVASVAKNGAKQPHATDQQNIAPVQPVIQTPVHQAEPVTPAQSSPGAPVSQVAIQQVASSEAGPVNEKAPLQASLAHEAHVPPQYATGADLGESVMAPDGGQSVDIQQDRDVGPVQQENGTVAGAPVREASNKNIDFVRSDISPNPNDVSSGQISTKTADESASNIENRQGDRDTEKTAAREKRVESPSGHGRNHIGEGEKINFSSEPKSVTLLDNKDDPLRERFNDVCGPNCGGNCATCPVAGGTSKREQQAAPAPT